MDDAGASQSQSHLPTPPLIGWAGRCCCRPGSEPPAPSPPINRVGWTMLPPRLRATCASSPIHKVGVVSVGDPLIICGNARHHTSVLCPLPSSSSPTRKVGAISAGDREHLELVASDQLPSSSLLPVHLQPHTSSPPHSRPLPAHSHPSLPLLLFSSLRRIAAPLAGQPPRLSHPPAPGKSPYRP